MGNPYPLLKIHMYSTSNSHVVSLWHVWIILYSLTLAKAKGVSGFVLVPFWFRFGPAKIQATVLLLQGIRVIYSRKILAKILT